MAAHRHCALLLAAMLSTTAAYAEISPERGSYDARVRVVDYNSQNVVRLTTFYGVSTHIQFGDGEKIVDIASGDDSAWKLVPRSGNHLFIKPKATEADTNLTVVTSKRTYQFTLIVRPVARTNDKAWRDPNLIYSLSFRYPDEILAKQQADYLALQKKSEKNTIEQRFSKSNIDDPNTNYDYWVAGAPEVSPTRVKDNGQFMRFQFAHNRDMPAFFEEDSDGNEHKVPTNVEGNEIVVHRMYRKIVMRKGEFVACVINKSFQFDSGRDNTSGTSVPNVKRVIKGEDQ